MRGCLPNGGAARSQRSDHGGCRFRLDLSQIICQSNRITFRLSGLYTFRFWEGLHAHSCISPFSVPFVPNSGENAI